MAIAVIRYTFQFDPAETWSSLSEFEKVITDTLGSIGLEANLVQPLGAPSTERWIIISKKPAPTIPAPKQGNPNQILKTLQNKNSYK